MTDDDLTRKLDELGYNSPRLFLFCKSLLAAGASEGQAEPVAWIATESTYPSPRFVIGSKDPSDVWDQRYAPLYLHPSDEIAALRERIAGMEKDAERFREAGVWEPDGKKFMTYRAENLSGIAMYVKEPK